LTLNTFSKIAFSNDSLLKNKRYDIKNVVSDIEILYVEWRALEVWVKGHPRSLKMMLFNKPSKCMIAKPLTELTIKHGPNKIIWTDIHDPSKINKDFGSVSSNFFGGEGGAGIPHRQA